MDAGGTATAGMTRTPPRAYQEELFSAVMECEQNSLVYLPTGLGKTLVASMVLRRLLDLNPDRQTFFLVETTALAMQQVNLCRCWVVCGRAVAAGLPAAAGLVLAVLLGGSNSDGG